MHRIPEVTVTALAEGRKPQGTCGYPDEMRGNALVCTIRDGDRVLFESPRLDEAHRQAPFEVALPPTRPLKLELRTEKTHLRMVQAVWTDLKFGR